MDEILRLEETRLSKLIVDRVDVVALKKVYNKIVKL